MKAQAPHGWISSARVEANGGFTLLELLVGMAVFALMAGIVLGGVRLGVKSWDAAVERSDVVDEMRVVHTLLRRQLGSALPLAISRAGGWNLVFDGDAETVQFVSELPGYVSGGGIHFVSLELAEDDEGKNLLLTWRPIHTLDEDVPPDQAVLARQIRELRIEYFGARTRNALPEWRDEWRELRTMPRLVKLVIDSENGDVWPELVVALDVDAVRFIRSSETEGRPGPDPEAEDAHLEQSS